MILTHLIIYSKCLHRRHIHRKGPHPDVRWPILILRPTQASTRASGVLPARIINFSTEHRRRFLLAASLPRSTSSFTAASCPLGATTAVSGRLTYLSS